MSGRRVRRGGVLFEAIVALGIFIAAATFVLRALENVSTAMYRSQLRQEAVDVARSKLAELEAGLVALNDLRSTELTSIGTFEQPDVDSPPRWMLDVDTERTEWGSLVLVEVTVSEADAGFGPDFADEAAPRAEPITVTLRQLMRLREEDVEDFEADTLLDGLPAEEPLP
ncbi:MAG: type IV pilus modification PilV family protein [Planctomycetota bacterium]